MTISHFDITKLIDAERARRPQGWAQRCARCWYWEVEDLEQALENDEIIGACHRYAPHMPHHHSAEALGLIAWAVETSANIEHGNFDYGFECVEHPFSDWPRTRAHDWCGEFLKRE